MGNSELWNDEMKQVVNSKKEVWLNVLKANDEVSKDRCMKVYEEEKRKTKRCISRRKKRGE